MKLLDRIFRRKPRPTDNVTPRAQRLLVLARREADRFGQGTVGSEYLLLGLLAQEEGVGFVALKNLGADIGKIRRCVEDELRYGQQLRVEPKILASEEFMRAFRRAGIEAELLNHSYLGTEHILLALFSLTDGIASRALKSVPVDISVVREMVLKTLISEAAPKQSQSKQNGTDNSGASPVAPDCRRSNEEN